MDRMQIRLGLALAEAGVPVSMDKFSDRLSLQKIVYLLKDAGVPLAYKYNWYIRGPYSPSLAEDLFHIDGLTDKGASELEGWTYEPDMNEKIAKLKPLFTREHKDLERFKWLELLASIQFLFRTGQAAPNDLQGIQRILKVNDKIYTNSQVEEGIKALKEYGYLKEEK